MRLHPHEGPAREGATSALVRAASFPRTARSLAAERSFRVVLLAALGATALGAWILWAASGGFELVGGRGRPADGRLGGRSGARPQRSSSPSP